MRSATIIRQTLQDVDKLHFQRVPREANTQTNYLLLGWIEGDRDKFHRNLTAAGLPCTPFYPHTPYNNPLYRDRANRVVMPCPNAEARIKDAFWIPHRALLGDDDDAQNLAAAIRKALGN